MRRKSGLPPKKPEGYVKVTKKGSIIFLCCPEEKVPEKYTQRKVSDRLIFLRNDSGHRIGFEFPPGFSDFLKAYGVVSGVGLLEKIVEAEIDFLDHHNGITKREREQIRRNIEKAEAMGKSYSFELGSKSTKRLRLLLDN